MVRCPGARRSSGGCYVDIAVRICGRVVGKTTAGRTAIIKHHSGQRPSEGNGNYVGREHDGQAEQLYAVVHLFKFYTIPDQVSINY